MSLTPVLCLCSTVLSTSVVTVCATTDFQCWVYWSYRTHAFKMMLLKLICCLASCSYRVDHISLNFLLNCFSPPLKCVTLCQEASWHWLSVQDLKCVLARGQPCKDRQCTGVICNRRTVARVKGRVYTVVVRLRGGKTRIDEVRDGGNKGVKDQR